MIGDCICPTHHSKDKDGYSKLKHQRRIYSLHRLVWSILYGPIPEGHVIGHRCNNKACGNPLHLYVTTAAANSADAARDGLYRSGDRHPKTKRTDAEVCLMWDMYHTEGMTQQSIGDLFGISQSRVSDCIRRATKLMEKDNR